MTELELKVFLKSKDNHIKLNTINRMPLTLSMLKYIGSRDAELRDTLIYTNLAKWISAGEYTQDQLTDILEICVSDAYLFKQIDRHDPDAVFTRSFSLLIITVILNYHNQKGELIPAEQTKAVYQSILEYGYKEKDRRGFVLHKGWAHAVAHLADAIVQLSYINDVDHLELLDLIAHHLDTHDICYNFGEDERLVTAFIAILKSNRVNQQDIIAWLHCLSILDLRGNWPNDYWLINNKKAFLRSLYFRLKGEASYNKIVTAVQQVLQKIAKQFTEY